VHLACQDLAASGVSAGFNAGTELKVHRTSMSYTGNIISNYNNFRTDNRILAEADGYNWANDGGSCATTIS
jgi:hypothetical protein